MKKLLFLGLVTASLYAQTASFPNSVTSVAKLGQAVNYVSTALSAQAAPTDTSLTVVGASVIAPYQLLNIDNEIVFVCNVVGNTVYVGYSACPYIDGRGFNGTTATTHLLNAGVYGYVNAWNVMAPEVETVAIETTLGANLANVPRVYTNTGTQRTAQHLVTGSATLSGGTLAVNLSGSAVFTNTASYWCFATDSTSAAAIKVVHTSATVVTFSGTSTDTFDWGCWGS
jgi:hypothetical protein